MAKRGRRGRQGSAVAERLGQARGEVTRVSQRVGGDAVTRLRKLERALPIDAATVGVHARRGGWTAVRVAGAGLSALPEATFSAARTVAKAADGAATRTAVVGERAREFADDLPSSRRRRRRTLARTVGWSVAAFGAGAVVGWMIAKRDVVDPIEQARAAFEDEATASVSVSSDADATAQIAADLAAMEAVNGAEPTRVEREAGE